MNTVYKDNVYAFITVFLIWGQGLRHICKIQIGVRCSNPCLISTEHLYLRSMSFFQILKSASNSQIHVLFQILKSMAVSHFLKSMSNDVTDVYPNL
jgi:hypothetical protein